MSSGKQWVDHVVFDAPGGALHCVPCGVRERLLGAPQLDAFLGRHAGCQGLVSARRQLLELLRARSSVPAPFSSPPRHEDVWPDRRNAN